MKENLRRLQSFMQANPMTAWVTGVAIHIALFGILFWIIKIRADGGMLLWTAFVFTNPTWLLINRLSETKLAENPLPVAKIEKVGEISVAVAALSMTSLAAFHFHRKLGIQWSDDVKMVVLFTFSWSAILAVAFGFAARNTRAGRRGVVLALSWIGLLLALGSVLLIRESIALYQGH